MDKLTRFRQLIEERTVREPMTGCWLWTRSATPGGYGDFRMGSPKKHHYAHRAAYEAYNGPIPEGMHVCHRCDVRCCVNPAHLFAGTNQDNIAYSVAKGRRKGVPRRGRPKGMSNNWDPVKKAEWIEKKRKLKAADRAAALEMLLQGHTQARVAAHFGISQPCISRLWGGR